jgi:hypothetical protein
LSASFNASSLCQTELSLKSKSTQVTVGKTPRDDVSAGTHIKVVSRIATVMGKVGVLNSR